MLYESYIHPITILSTLPSAGVGALLALMLCRTDLTVIALIGIILLIGIVKKNAILMIDFALEAERTRGQASGGGHLPGLPAALPADHDDDDGGAARRPAAGARHRHRIGVAPAARHRDCRRPDLQPAADALHDAGRLPVPRSSSTLVGSDAPRAIEDAHVQPSEARQTREGSNAPHALAHRDAGRTDGLGLCGGTRVQKAAGARAGGLQRAAAIRRNGRRRVEAGRAEGRQRSRGTGGKRSAMPS